MGQVAAVGEAHAQNGVAGLQYGSVNRLVGLRTGMRLNIGVFGAEQFFHAVDGKLLCNIDVFAAAVIAFAGVAFSVFVGQLRPLCFHHGATDIVFRSNQLDVVLLALVFGGDRSRQFGIVLLDGYAFRKHFLSPLGMDN